VEMPLRYRSLGAGERRGRIERVLDLVGLAARRHALPEELSGGQQQRVAIARALVGDPRLLLADEPTGNLDSQMARRILELLQEVNRRGVTVVMVTHAPELAARAHRKLHILDGRAIDPLLRRLDPTGPPGPWRRDA
jgi:putative ABC transport system ATP-binding protein